MRVSASGTGGSSSSAAAAGAVKSTASAAGTTAGYTVGIKGPRGLIPVIGIGVVIIVIG